MSEEDQRTPWQAERDAAEKTGAWPGNWGPFHRHFANDAVHRDGGPECDQPGTPRRVYVFDPDVLDKHERTVARYAAQHPEEFLDSLRAAARPANTSLPAPDLAAALVMAGVLCHYVGGSAELRARLARWLEHHEGDLDEQVVLWYLTECHKLLEPDCRLPIGWDAHPGRTR